MPLRVVHLRCAADPPEALARRLEQHGRVLGGVDCERDVGGDAERVRRQLGEADLRSDREALDEPPVRLRQISFLHRDARKREAHVRDTVPVADPALSLEHLERGRAREREVAGCSYDSARFPSTIRRRNSSVVELRLPRSARTRWQTRQLSTSG